MMNNTTLTLTQCLFQKIEENEISKKHKNIRAMQQKMPSLTDDEASMLYDTAISCRQGNIQSHGNFLEVFVCDALNKHNISYKQQVTINNAGIIVGYNKKKGDCYHVIDVVVGENIEIGKSITEYIVISCKTTCRERWTQDAWTFNLPPVLYILLTISNDYPKMERFKEDAKRKILTCSPRKKDYRLCKLNFDGLINEIQQALTIR